MQHDRHSLRFGCELVERVLLGCARVDHERLAAIAGERDLRGECACLIGARRAVAVVVEARLADRHATLVFGQRAQLREIGGVEASGRVRMTSDRGIYLREVLCRCQRRAAGRAIDADGQQARDSDPLGGRDERGVRRLAQIEVGVGVDQAAPAENGGEGIVRGQHRLFS